MGRLRTFTLGLALIAPALAPMFVGAATGAAVACAAETAGEPHAALVVDTGPRTTTYCVALGGGSVSGLRLIQLAADQYGLSYHFGFGGQAVCQLQGVGPSGGDCFGDYPDYWGYWHGSGGGWTWAGSGAASSSVGDGEVEGWSWGPGDSGATHPSPPALAFGDVCDIAEPSPSHSPRPSPPPASPSPHAGGGVASPAAPSSPEPTAADPPGTDGTGGPEPTRTPVASATVVATASPTDDIVRAVATSGSAPSSGGPPRGAIAAMATAIILGVIGARTLRRRRGSGPA